MSTPDRPESGVAVVGAGPAGLAAALAAAGLGCAVTLIDAGQAIGGQIYRPSLLGPGAGHDAPASERLPPRLHRAARHRRIRHLAATSVWHAEPEPSGGFLLRLAGPDRPGPAPGGGPGEAAEPAPAGLLARSVVLATGANELVLPFPGWDLPGVTTAGAAQALLKSQGVTVGRRVLVAGSGPVLLPVAASLAEAGVRVVAVLEATPAPPAGGLAAYPGQRPET